MLYLNNLIDLGLKTYKLPPEVREDFKSIWRPLFIMQLAIVILTILTALFLDDIFSALQITPPCETFTKEVIVSILVICSNLLIVINTGSFVKDGSIVLTFLNSSQKKRAEIKDIQKRYLRFSSMSRWAAFLSIILIALYFLRLAFTNFSIEWDILFYINELTTIIIFILFVKADKLLLNLLENAVFSNANTHATVANEKEIESIDFKKELTSLKLFTSNAYALIDIAGLVGVILITVLSLVMHIMHIPKIHFFTQGFSIGALAFHIIFTQINFAHLKTRELVDSY